MKDLPFYTKAYKQTQIFTQKSIPQGLLTNHSTKQGVWGLIHVLEGRLEFTINSSKTYVLELGKNGVIEPQVLHQVKPIGFVKFFIEFYQ